MHPLLRDFLELVAPSMCPGCDLPYARPAVSASAFCDGCAILVEPVQKAHRPPGRDSSGWLYGGPVADAISRIKYSARPELLRELAPEIRHLTRGYAGRVDAVVPAPLHSRRRQKRGFDQSAMIARSVAKGLGVPAELALLSRVRDTPPQAELSQADRVTNIRGAFRLTRPRPEGFRGRRLLLVDDVRTTGSTLYAAALPLTRAGADVYMFSLARAC